jgi:hypothetical protein
MINFDEEIEYLAEIAVYQDTLIYPHQYTVKEIALFNEYATKFTRMESLSAIRHYVFRQEKCNATR